jgi:hypothetical protein
VNLLMMDRSLFDRPGTSPALSCAAGMLVKGAAHWPPRARACRATLLVNLGQVYCRMGFRFDAKLSRNSHRLRLTAEKLSRCTIWQERSFLQPRCARNNLQSARQALQARPRLMPRRQFGSCNCHYLFEHVSIEQVGVRQYKFFPDHKRPEPRGIMATFRRIY